MSGCRPVRPCGELLTARPGLAVRTPATYVGAVDEEELAEPEFRFSASAFKRADELGYDEDDLERIVLNDPLPLELDQEVFSGPDDALIYMAHGWTRGGQYLEVGFISPDYGGGYCIIHAMKSRLPPGR